MMSMMHGVKCVLGDMCGGHVILSFVFMVEIGDMITRVSGDVMLKVVVVVVVVGGVKERIVMISKKLG